MTDPIAERVRAVVAATFGVAAGELTDESGADSIASWSSLNQIQLLVALEAELGVSFPAEVAAELTTVGAIVEAARRYQAR